MMKRYFLLLLFGCLVSTVLAYDFEQGNICYTVVSRTPLAVEVSASNHRDFYKGEIVIPESVSYNDKIYKVQAVAQRAFADSPSLGSLTIPATVTAVGDSAFYGCTGLKYLIVSDGNTPLTLGCNKYTGISAGEALFHDCPLETLYLGRELRYKEGFFYGYSPFYKKARLSLVIVGDGVRKIENRAFYGCKDLVSITIGGCVESIENYAFFECFALKELIVKEGARPLAVGMNRQGQNLFHDCPLETLYLGRELKYNDNITQAYNPFYKKESLRTVTIGDALETLPARAFYGCRFLISLTVGSRVRTIGNGAFDDCVSLRELYLNDGDSILSLGCNRHAQGTMGEGLFHDCPLETLYLGRTLDYSTSYFDGYSPFYKQEKLHTVVVGERVLSMGDRLFWGCENLSSATIGGRVEVIGNYVFKECRNLTQLVLHDGRKPLYMGYNRVMKNGIGEPLFSDSPLKTLYLGRTLVFNMSRFFGYSPFYRQTTLSSVTIGGNVERIEQNTFYLCSGLTAITIPAGVASIGGSAFVGCTSVSKLVLEDGNTVLALGTGVYDISGNKTVFQDMPLKTLYLGRDLQYTATVSGSTPFSGSEQLQSVEVGGTVTSLSDALFQNCAALESLTVGGRVERIGNRFVQGCTRLSRLVFEDGDAPLTVGYNEYAVSGMGYALFYDNPVRSLYLGRNLRYADTIHEGYAPFYRKTSLNEVIIGKSVTSLGNRIFYGCDHLASLVIKGRLATVGAYAFYGCPMQP